MGTAATTFVGVSLGRPGIGWLRKKSTMSPTKTGLEEALVAGIGWSCLGAVRLPFCHLPYIGESRWWFACCVDLASKPYPVACNFQVASNGFASSRLLLWSLPMFTTGKYMLIFEL